MQECVRQRVEGSSSRRPLFDRSRLSFAVGQERQVLPCSDAPLAGLFAGLVVQRSAGAMKKHDEAGAGEGLSDFDSTVPQCASKFAFDRWRCLCGSSQPIK